MKKILIVVLALAFNVQAETKTIGGLFSLSSFGQLEGEAERNGALLALKEDEAFKNGEIKFVVEDFGSEMTKTATSLRKLLDIDKASVVIGPNWDEFLAVAAPVAHNKRVPIIPPTGFATEANKENGCAFPIFTPAHDRILPLAKELKDKRVAIVVSQSQYFENLAKELSKEVKVIETYSALAGEVSFNSLISKIKNRSDVDAVVVFLFENGSFSAFLKQAKTLELKVPLFGANQIAYDDEVKKNLSIAEGFSYFDYIVKGSAEFITRYKNEFGIEPREGSPFAYDAAHLALKFLKECTVAKDVCACLRGLQHEGQTGFIGFGADGQRVNPPLVTEMRTVRNGAIQKDS